MKKNLITSSDIEAETERKIYFSKPQISENNAILDELNSFALSIKNNEKPRVDISDGHNALDVAIKIIKNLNKYENISVIGSGTMENGIAQTFALFNFKVRLYDINSENLKKVNKPF